ncbi:hypothetical protein T484DRAFT_1798816, partial [Baffinella frigidus]
MTACESSDWHSDSSLQCRVASGGFGTLRTALTVGERAGTYTELLSYDVGAAMSLSPNAPATGLAWVTVAGADLGVSKLTGSVRVGATACEATEWVSDTAVEARVARGVSGTLRVVVTSGGRGGSVTEAASYDVPAALGVGMVNGPTAGGWDVVVVMSTRVLVYSDAARIGGTACEMTSWASDSGILCKTVWRAGGGTRGVVVTSGSMVGSVTEVLTYDAVKLTFGAVTDLVFPTDGDSVVQ